MKSFTYSGEWWLPTQEGHKVAGEVTFTGEEQTKLVLQGAFIHDFQSGRIELSWYPLILGLTDAGQPITLLHCQETSFGSYTETDRQGETQECLAEVAFIGNHFADPEQILFNTIDIYYNYLPHWAGVFHFGYPIPSDEIQAVTTKGIISVQPVPTSPTRKVDLAETMRVRCEVTEALTLDEWVRQFVAPLQHLISLATQRPNALGNIVGYVQLDRTDQVNDAPSDVSVQIAFPPAIRPIPTSKSTTPRTILFSLQTIKDNFSSVIDIWLRMADELDSMYSLFFGVQYTNPLLDLQFLLLAQAVEVYQDNRFEKAAFSDEVYQHLIDTLLAACPDKEQREWLEEKIAHKNNSTFRQQLRKLVSKTNDILKPFLGENSKKRNDFVEVLYCTRNYLTHHTKTLAPYSATGIELFYITHSLSLALQVCLMQELGFTTEQLIEIVRRHESYRLLSVLQSQVNLEKFIRRTS